MINDTLPSPFNTLTSPPLSLPLLLLLSSHQPPLLPLHYQTSYENVERIEDDRSLSSISFASQSYNVNVCLITYVCLCVCIIDKE